MKTIVTTVLTSLFFVVLSANSYVSQTKEPRAEIVTSDFCKGWEDGYCEGWKDVKEQSAICPITPICPIPDIGQDTYRGGYNRGFKAGMKAAQGR